MHYLDHICRKERTSLKELSKGRESNSASRIKHGPVFEEIGAEESIGGLNEVGLGNGSWSLLTGGEVGELSVNCFMDVEACSENPRI